MAIPLNELLSDALADLTREIDDDSIPVYANLLRLIPEGGLGLRDVPALARVSKRAAHWNAAIAQRNGWVTVTDKTLRLTASGRAVRDGCAIRVDAAEAAWRERLGDDTFAKLRKSLEALVSQFDLELPHYAVGYGPADPSVTGGVSGRWGRRHALRAKGLSGLVFDPKVEHDAAEAWEVESGGRLYVRDTGQDWRPVARGEGDTVSSLPLSALLSQVLMAFAIDYEGCGGLGLARSGNVLRAIGDGMEVKIRAARSLGMPTVVPVESTLAGLERHAFAALTPDPNDKRTGWLTLTEKGRLVRDAYDDIVVAIEERWKRRYGATLMRTLRTVLTSSRRRR